MPDGRVEAQPLQISEEMLFNLEDIPCFFTRSSTSVNFILIFRSLWPLVPTDVPCVPTDRLQSALERDVFRDMITAPLTRSDIALVVPSERSVEPYCDALFE